MSQKSAVAPGLAGGEGGQIGAPRRYANSYVKPYARIQAEVQHPCGVNPPHTAAHVHNTSFLTHADQLPPDMSFLCRRNMTPIVLGPQWQATVQPECASQI